MKEHTVYMHISPSNKRYIGITSQKNVNKRWQNGGGYKTNTHFWRAICKYGWDNFQHIIIARGLDEETAKWLEIELIREWDSTNKNKGYNGTKGGDDSYERTEEIKEKNRKGKLGKKHTEETIEKIRKASLGREKSDEEREKLSKSLMGHEVTEETKRKIGEKQKGGNNHNARKVICLETMEIFECVTFAWQSINGSPMGFYKTIKNNKKYKGYTFMYYEDYLKTLE